MMDASHRLAAVNAAENLLALCHAWDGWSSRHRDYVIADAGPRGCRVITTRPAAAQAAVISEFTGLAARHVPQRDLVVEDTFATLPLEHHGFVPLARVPVMVRDAGPPPGDQSGSRGPEHPQPLAAVITAAASQQEADQVERVMVEGLPLPALQPWRPGVLFPPNPAAIPGWLMWLARVNGETAGSCASFHDGSSVGLYGMAVYPRFRRQGIGRLLVEAIAARYPGTVSCLTATDEGFWLYASAGYRTVGVATWWRRGLDRTRGQEADSRP